MTTEIYFPPADPSEKAPYPRSLALDLALNVGTLKEILESYDISPEKFKRILANPAFQQEYTAHMESMKTEGWSFRKKCQAQAELYLNMIYRLASGDHTPAAVRADLMKSVVKWAGLDSPTPINSQTPEQLLPQMAEQLKNMPEGELEMRVLQIIARKPAQQPAPTPVGLVIDQE